MDESPRTGTGEGSRVSRRAVVATGLLGTAGIGATGYAMTRYLRDETAPDSRAYPERSYGDPDREFRLTASVGGIDVGDDDTVETWLYNGQYPGPELRVKEGERVRITVENDLDEATSVHWHGMSLPDANGMDGVPGVTQPPIEPNGEFVYEFDVTPTGTHWYHSHVDLQLDRGLLGPLIVEEDDPHVDYDREHVVVLDEHLAGEPEVTTEDAGMMGGFPGGPSYDGTLVNGRLPGAAETLSVADGDRVRLRFLNVGSATTYRVTVAGHPMTVTHADGPAVEPIEVDQFDIGMGERLDAVIEATDPGTWEIQARPLDDETPAGRALLQYESGDAAEIRSEPPGSSRLEDGDLRAVTSLDRYEGTPDRTIELELRAGGMMGGEEGTWTINGQAYPDADPVPVEAGEHVRLQIRNRSPMRHPMHLHGHHFAVDGALQDTVTVPGHMGRRTLDLVADNPGDWFFHCHHLYHMETGMVRVFEYE